MKPVIATVLTLALAVPAIAQVSTNCTTIGNQTNCTSVDYGAQQRQAYEQGQQFGSAMGNMFAALAQRHQYHKLINQQCHRNGPGSAWSVIWPSGATETGVCTDKQAGIKKHK